MAATLTPEQWLAHQLPQRGPHVIAPAADESLVRRDRKGKAVGRAALPTQLRFKLLLQTLLGRWLIRDN